MKQKIIAKKTGEMKDYMQDVKGVLNMYVPPDPQKMQAAYQAGKLSLNPVPGAVNLVFTDYAQPGDKMTLTFDTAAKKITGSEHQYLHGAGKRCREIASADGQPSRRHQLCPADSA